MPARPRSVSTGQSSKLPDGCRMRVRMYRHGLGDCFLLSFPKMGGDTFHAVIDCGVLMGTEDPYGKLSEVVKDIATQTNNSLDLLIVTHEHWDHLSGFIQAQKEWDKIKIEKVWMGWTDDPNDAQARHLNQEENAALRMLHAAAEKLPAGLSESLSSLLSFGGPLAASGRSTKDALEYLRRRGLERNGVDYLQPGQGPLVLPGVPGVNIYVLGPPRNEKLLKKSDAYNKEKEDGVIFHLHNHARSLAAAAGVSVGDLDPLREAPFTASYRIYPEIPSAFSGWIEEHYKDKDSGWRTINDEWFQSFNELALKLDNDTNNTSLVLAFELVDTGEVALFVGDAQVGNWQSWNEVKFPAAPELTTSDLLSRTSFYKVGHHASHNATLAKGGLDLMNRQDLVAFISVDKTTAAAQGRKEHGKPKGWAMPAKPLYKELVRKTAGRTVLSDARESPPMDAFQSLRSKRLLPSDLCIDLFL